MAEIIHGTPAGFDAGCKTRPGCPAAIPCRTVWMRYRSDLGFRRQIDAGVALEQIIAGDLADQVADVLAEREARRVERVLTHAPRQRDPKREAGERSRREWTTTDDEAIRHGHDNNLTVSDIAAILGRGRQLVKDHAEAMGLRLRDGRAGRTIPAKEPEQGEPVAEVLHGTVEGYEAGCFTVDCPASPTCAEVNLIEHGVMDAPRPPREPRIRTPRVRREPVEVEHGSLTCKEAQRTYHVEYMAKKRREAIPAEKHGTAYGYQLGCTAGQPCPSSPSCAEVVRAEEKARDRAAGIPEREPLTEAGPVREHVRDLMKSMTLDAIAEQAGVHRSQLGNLIYGRSGERGRSGGPMQKVTASRAERIMAVQP